MPELSRGTYRTRGGHTAHVTSPWRDGEGWAGTTEGVGWSDWYNDGRSYDGETEFDIVLEENGPGGENRDLHQK